jgi:hypothetical protein
MMLWTERAEKVRWDPKPYDGASCQQQLYSIPEVIIQKTYTSNRAVIRHHCRYTASPKLLYGSHTPVTEQLYGIPEVIIQKPYTSHRAVIQHP